ncbi:hypothetical protein KAH81_09740 [bacterium]|nr:hypothetical protein [bacterium]
MFFWALAIIILSIAMILSSALNLEAFYHVTIAGAILMVSLLMMYKYIITKPTDRQKILEKQLDEISEENNLLRKKT